MSITAERASELLVYSPLSGEFRWRFDVSTKCRAGSLAGTWRADRDGQRYLIIKLDGQNYRAHRLAWLIMTGEHPVAQVDHRNTVKGDNRWDNLREASDAQNKANRPVQKRSASGVKGVRWHARDRRWEARITDPALGRIKTIGYFQKIEDAAAAYQAEAFRIHGDFAYTP